VVFIECADRSLSDAKSVRRSLRSEFSSEELFHFGRRRVQYHHLEAVRAVRPKRTSGMLVPTFVPKFVAGLKISAVSVALPPTVIPSATKHGHPVTPPRHARSAHLLSAVPQKSCRLRGNIRG
jgi:hypothetical protein